MASFEPSDQNVEHLLSKLIIDIDICLSQEVVDFCAGHDLSFHICSELYTAARNRLLESENLFLLPDSCATPAHASSHSLLSMESLLLDGELQSYALSYGKGKVIVWMFWDRGDHHMPPALRYVYHHNKLMASCHGYSLHLVTNKNIGSYLNVSSFHPLAHILSPAQFSDYVRVQLLYHFGGLWLDCDFIMVGDIARLLNLMDETNTTLLLTEEFAGKVGSAVMGTRVARSEVVTSMLYELHSQLDFYDSRLSNGLEYMHRDFIGPDLVRNAIRRYSYVAYPQKYYDDATNSPIVLLLGEITNRGMHFAVWSLNPVYNYALWLLNSELDAISFAASIESDSFGIVGLWTLANTGGSDSAIPFWVEAIFGDTRSLFYQLLLNAQTKVINQMHRDIYMYASSSTENHPNDTMTFKLKKRRTQH